MGVIQDQVRFLVNLLLRKRMIDDGRLPVPDEIQEFLNAMDSKIGMPMMTPRLVARGQASNPELYNKTFEEVGFDLNLLFYTARRGATSLINGFQFNHIQLNNLLRRAHGIRRDVNTLIQVSDRTTGMLDNIYEDFNDLTNIDTVNTTAEVDTKYRIVRLGAAGAQNKLVIDPILAGVTVQATESMEGKGVSAVQFDLLPGSSGPEALFNDYANDFWGMMAKKVTDGPIEWKMTVTLPEEVEIGRVQIEFQARKSAYIGLTVYDKDGKGDFRGQNSGVDAAEWSFSPRKVKQLTFVFRTEAYTKENGFNLFYLICVNLSLYLDVLSGEASLYTKQMRLQFNNRVDRLTLVSTQEGVIDWFTQLTYKELDGSITISPWLAIRPAGANLQQGDPVILGALEDIKPTVVTLEENGIRMITPLEDAVAAYITPRSLKFTAGLNLWRVDYQAGPFVSGRYVAGNGAVDMDTAKTAHLGVEDLRTDIQGSFTKVEMFHRFRLTAVVYIDPTTYTSAAKKITLKTSTPYLESGVNKDRYLPPVMQVHSIETVAQTLAGIDTVNVALTRTETAGGLTYTSTNSVILNPGLNYVVVYFDTGIDRATLSEQDLLKAVPMSISFAVEDEGSQTLTHGLNGFLTAGTTDHIFAAPKDPADVQQYRRVLPFSKLSSKFAYDYNAVAIEEVEDAGTARSRFFINHPFMDLPAFSAGVFPKPVPSEQIPAVDCMLSYKKMVRDIQSVAIWARLKKGDVLPTIKDFSLRFSI